MAKHIDPASLPRDVAEAMLSQSIHASDIARAAAGIAGGARGRRYASIARQHNRNAMVLADTLYGPVDADIAGMTPDELLRELGV